MKAGLLADRLTNATATLIRPVASETSPDHRPEPIDSILDSLHGRYVKLFCAGLQFKAATAITNNKYEFVLQLPGTLTGQQGLEQTIGSPSTTRGKMRKRTTRTSWFHASLKVFDAGPRNWLNPLTDAIIQTDNFVPRTSKTNRPCVYEKDILIERSDIRDDSSSLTMHNTLRFSVRPPLSRPLNIQFNDADTRRSSRSEMEERMDGAMDRSFQNVLQSSSNGETQQHQSSYTSTKEVVARDGQINNENRRRSELTAVEEVYETDSGALGKQAGCPRSETLSLGSRASGMRGAADDHICRMCGAPLANYDTRRRHEKNGIFSNNRHQLKVAYSK